MEVETPGASSLDRKAKWIVAIVAAGGAILGTAKWLGSTAFATTQDVADTESSIKRSVETQLRELETRTLERMTVSDAAVLQRLQGTDAVILEKLEEQRRLLEEQRADMRNLMNAIIDQRRQRR